MSDLRSVAKVPGPLFDWRTIVVAEIGMRTDVDSSTTKSPWVEFSADIFTPPAGGGGARSSAAVAMG